MVNRLVLLLYNAVPPADLDLFEGSPTLVSGLTVFVVLDFGATARDAPALVVLLV